MAGCLASLAIHVVLFAFATRYGDAFAGWTGSGSAGSGDGEPSFTIHVRKGRLDGWQEASVFDAQAVAAATTAQSEPREPVPELFELPENAAVQPEPSRDTHANDPVDPSIAAIPAYSVEPAIAAVEPTSPSNELPSKTDSSPRADETPSSTELATGALPSPPAAPLGRTDGGADGRSDGGADGATGGGARSDTSGDVAATSGDGTGVAGTASDGTDQRPVYAPKPEYPAMSRRLGEEGQVHVRITVGRDGRVLSVKLAKSCGFPRLDRAAIETIERWRFTAMDARDARPSVTIEHRVTFRLR